MEKYGVNEAKSLSREQKEKVATGRCPECGDKLVQHGDTWLCPKYGSEPFENPDFDKCPMAGGK